MKRVLKKIPKINYIIGLSAIILLASLMLPSLARYENRVPTTDVVTWDGTVATSYRKGSGTKDDPYVIANGKELAYFAEMLQTNDYENTYFVLSNDIVLNDGIFEYDETNKITYKLSNSIFYLKEYTNEFYDNVNYENAKIGTVNLFSSLDNFKGYFDGKFYTIYGLYLTNNDDLALFTNLSGEVKNLYVDNAMIYGGNNTAGIASNSSNNTLSNILFNGYVVGTNTKSNNKEVTLSDQNVTVSNEIIENTITIPNFNIKNITKTTLTGTITGDGIVTINGSEVSGDFNLDLGNSLINELVVSYTASTTTNFTITNLKYNITYNTANTSGIIGLGNNVTLNNVINKSIVYGNINASGIIASATNVTINNSYNIGSINGNVSSGIISNTNETINLNKVYNSGTIVGDSKAGLINDITNSTVNITNTFDAQDSTFSVNNITNSTVTINNSYAINSNPINGTNETNFITTTLTNLNTKEYIINNLYFNEFIDHNDLNINPNNLWIYEEDSLPILYIDDIKNPIANIYVGTYTWNNLGISSNLIYFDSNITFSIEQIDNLRPLEEINYYIHNSQTPLTKEQLETITWTSYQDITQITEEGFYIVYAKVIDSNNNIIYLNTDTLVLDKTNPTVTINLNDTIWNSYNDNINYLYINQNTNYSINVSDNLSGISSVEYYVTNELLTLEQLNNVTWTNYVNPLTIDTLGTYIIYAKVVDNCGYITYVNSDYIIYNGYSLNSLKAGYSNEDANYISDLSSVTLNFTYQDDNVLNSSETHNIISNVLLPTNTIITLIFNDKVYTYKTTTYNYGYDTSCETDDCKYATYPFTLFKELGKANDTYYVEQPIAINENITINFDFKEAEINKNYENITLSLAIKNNNIVRDTLANTKKSFSIIDSSSSNLYLNTDYSNQPIQYNSNSTTEININAGLTYSTINGNKIYDTINENKIIGLAIKLVDSENNIIPKEKLKNLRFKIGDKDYSPSDDGLVRINLENGINSTNTTLTIITYEDESNLTDGNYSFVINSYLADDGMYTNNYSTDAITIPVSVSNYVEANYNFDVLFDSNYKVINGNVTLDLSILQNGTTNGSIRVSLYKKDQLTAYNQDYTLINLGDYINDNFTLVKENVYNLIENPKEYNNTLESYNNVKINLNSTNLENGGYKLMFELFDGDQRVGVIEKKFIVR